MTCELFGSRFTGARRSLRAATSDPQDRPKADEAWSLKKLILEDLNKKKVQIAS